MNEKNIRLVTAESVRAGHPDKFCDQVADAILDAHLRLGPNARVAVEVFATAGKIIVGGEVTSKATVSYDKIVAGVINRIGYTMEDLCENPHGLLDLEVCLHEQSPDISAAVSKAELGAGDQGIVVGYATSETESIMNEPFNKAAQNGFTPYEGPTPFDEKPKATVTPVSEPKLTIVELRAFVAARSTPENRSKIKAILTKYGVKKLTELQESQYEAVKSEVAAL